MREHWGGCRSSSSCLMIIGLTAGTAGDTHRLGRSGWVNTMEGHGWLGSWGLQAAPAASGGRRVASGPCEPGYKKRTREVGVE